MCTALLLFKLCLLVFLPVLIDLYNSSLIQQYESNLYYYPTTGLYLMRNTTSDSATYHIRNMHFPSVQSFLCLCVCVLDCVHSFSVCVCVCVIENNRNGSRTGFEPAQSKYITTANPACLTTGPPRHSVFDHVQYVCICQTLKMSTSIFPKSF